MVWQDIGENEIGVVRGVGVCFVRPDPQSPSRRAEVATYMRYHDHTQNPHSVHEFNPDQARALAALLILAANLADQ